MKRLAVIASGWHYGCQFYEQLSLQRQTKDWEVDLFVISHRHPEHIDTVKEKEEIRNKKDEDFLSNLDKMLYKYPISKQQIQDLGWVYIEKPNTIGDMEVFNQWTEDYDYSKYDLFLITHDDNLILSTSLFTNVLENKTNLYKPIKESRYGVSNHQFKTELTQDSEWLFLDNGYTENIPKAFTPRGSFSFYKKELIDLLPNNKFDMSGVTLTREGKTNSPGHMELNSWNTNAGNFRDFLYNNVEGLELVDKTRWLSNTKRISEYCIEGERGLISNCNADSSYIKNLQKKLEEINWI
tara:strand:+ start:2120 stop:3007 length:888 start_codon:yes stop_codon:yes gene_type:complete